MAGDAPAYFMNEGSLPLDAPGVWEDQTLHVLRLPAEGQASASLVVSREVLPFGMEVEDYVRAELQRLKASLPEFTVVGWARVDWPDAPGEAVMTRWRTKEGPMDQITACRAVGGRRALIFTATHPSPMPQATYQAVLAVISGFRPRPGVPGPARG
jgi:hypothetical protein